jgi:hypothetical protein
MTSRARLRNGDTDRSGESLDGHAEEGGDSHESERENGEKQAVFD